MTLLYKHMESMPQIGLYIAHFLLINDHPQLHNMSVQSQNYLQMKMQKVFCAYMIQADTPRTAFTLT